MRIVSSFKTAEYHGYNVKYAPFSRDVLACATSENYGIAGNTNSVKTVFIFAFL